MLGKKGLPLRGTPAYWVRLKATKKMKCFEYNYRFRYYVSLRSCGLSMCIYLKEPQAYVDTALKLQLPPSIILTRNRIGLETE